jgi:hypothetical protein
VSFPTKEDIVFSCIIQIEVLGVRNIKIYPYLPHFYIIGVCPIIHILSESQPENLKSPFR